MHTIPSQCFLGELIATLMSLQNTAPQGGSTPVLIGGNTTLHDIVGVHMVLGHEDSGEVVPTIVLNAKEYSDAA